MIFLLYGIVTLLAIGMVISLMIFGSKIIIKAAPFSMAALVGLTYGWFSFFFWLILLYALASYAKLRNAVLYVSISLAGSVIPAILFMFVDDLVAANAWTLAFLKLIVLGICTCLAFMVEAEREKPVCINVARILPLPVIVERILMSIIYGIGFMLAIGMSFVDVIHSTLVSTIVGNAIFIIVAIVAFYLDTKIDKDDKAIIQHLNLLKGFTQSLRLQLESFINKNSKQRTTK